MFPILLFALTFALSVLAGIARRWPLRMAVLEGIGWAGAVTLIAYGDEIGLPGPWTGSLIAACAAISTWILSVDPRKVDARDPSARQ
jgi:hypothetical protein